MKGNRQGFLSRSIPRRSGQNCKIILHFYILQFCPQLVKKVRLDFFDKLSRNKKRTAHAVLFYSFCSRYSAASALPFRKDGISGYSAGSVSPSRSFHTAAPAAVTRSATVCTPRTSRSSGSAA